jgi:hypothetical protein
LADDQYTVVGCQPYFLLQEIIITSYYVYGIINWTIIMLFKTLFNIALTLLFLISNVSAQKFDLKNHGKLVRLNPANSMFPDTARMNGHVYRDSLYSFEEHYNDSTALVYVPNHVSLEKNFDIIVYFHGWWNNVDSSLINFELAEQLVGSKRNAILILPEGPKNSADSYGGKLEQAGRFKKFIEEVLSHLPESSIQNPESSNYTLAGHSGANRVMAFILMHGGLTTNIKEVYLFDGLYSHVEKYTYWLDNFDGRFINIYTPDGGTKYLSENLMVSLKAWNMPFTHIPSDEFTDDDLKSNRIIIIESKLGHNEVINTQHQFKRFLQTGE